MIWQNSITVSAMSSDTVKLQYMIRQRILNAHKDVDLPFWLAHVFQFRLSFVSLTRVIHQEFGKPFKIDCCYLEWTIIKIPNQKCMKIEFGQKCKILCYLLYMALMKPKPFTLYMTLVRPFSLYSAFVDFCSLESSDWSDTKVRRLCSTVELKLFSPKSGHSSLCQSHTET